MNPESEGRARAEAYRERNGLGHQPLGDLVALIEQLEGIDVAVLPVDSPDAHGLSMRDPETGVVRIAAACTLNPMRQRSTLAHEIAHVMFDDHSDPNELGWGAPGPIETRATAFARHLLVPLDGLAAVLGTPDGRREITEAILSMLVQRFQASPSIVAIQLAAAKYIADPQKDEWMAVGTPTLAARHGWTEQYAALQRESNTHRSPQRLLARATDAYLVNAVSLAAIARIRQVTEEQLANEFAEAGLHPATVEPEWSDPTGLSDDIPVDLDALDAILSASA